MEKSCCSHKCSIVSYRIASYRVYFMYVCTYACIASSRVSCLSVLVPVGLATLLQHVDSDDTASASYPRRKRSDGLRVSSWIYFRVYLEVTTAVTMTGSQIKLGDAAAQPSVGQHHVSSGMMNKTRQRKWHKTRNEASEKETDRGYLR